MDKPKSSQNAKIRRITLNFACTRAIRPPSARPRLLAARRTYGTILSPQRAAQGLRSKRGRSPSQTDKGAWFLDPEVVSGAYRRREFNIFEVIQVSCFAEYAYK
ncbi:MAG: hypothetical protein Q8O41_06110, partial [Candidatus Methanoperedens sp.]|nr:hypothetical protein [Candidatus Methanoperedens sp.]